MVRFVNATLMLRLLKTRRAKISFFIQTSLTKPLSENAEISLFRVFVFKT